MEPKILTLACKGPPSKKLRSAISILGFSLIFGLLADTARATRGSEMIGTTHALPSRQAMMAEAIVIAQRRVTAERIDFCYRQTQALMEGVPLTSGAYAELQTAHAAVLFLQCQVVQESGALLEKRKDPRLSTGQIIDRLARAMGQSATTHAQVIESFMGIFE